MEDLRHPICAKSLYWKNYVISPVLAGCFTCNRETIKTLLKSEINPAKSFRELIYLLDYFGYLPAGLESPKLPRAIQELTEVNFHQLPSGPYNSGV
jgi:hypothetical protein